MGLRKPPIPHPAGAKRPSPVYEDWMARVPKASLDRVQAAVAAAEARSTTLSFDELADLCRLPSWVRAPREEREWWSWWADHQEPDGSWSPADFDWNCKGTKVCSGIGKESFRIAATSLIVFALTNVRVLPRNTDGPDRVAYRAIRFLLSQQDKDGCFCTDDTNPEMTNACAALAMCRVVAVFPETGTGAPLLVKKGARGAIARVQRGQNADGSFGGDPDGSRRLSTAVWCLLALKAADTARIPIDAAVTRRGLAWIEETVGALEIRGGLESDRSALPHARASRAVARLVTGGSDAVLTPELENLLATLNVGGAPAQDAETILFTALIQLRCHRDGASWEGLEKLVSEAQAPKSDGCSAGTWLMPSVWSDVGGRLFSTAVMSWARAVYDRYRYTLNPHSRIPSALWVLE